MPAWWIFVVAAEQHLIVGSTLESLACCSFPHPETKTSCIRSFRRPACAFIRFVPSSLTATVGFTAHTLLDCWLAAR